MYDYNNIFGYLDYTSSPPQTLQLSYYIEEENSFQIGLSYTVNVQIEPTSAWNENMKIKMRFANNQFIVTGSVCNSIAGEGPYIPALTKGEYACEIVAIGESDTQFFQNYVEILLKKSITANTRLTFAFTVKNPFIITSSNLQVTLAQASNNNIVEYNEIQDIVETLPLSWNYGKVYLAWGVEMSQNDLPPSIKPIRTSSAATQLLYNSFKFTFSTDYDTQTFLPIMIELNYKDDEGTVTLLQGSITENLPSCEDTQVTCINDNTNQKVQCKNICGLQKDYEYYIGIKVSFVYSGSNTALNQNFGKLIAYPIKNPSTQTYDSTALFESIQSNLILETANSQDWHTNDVDYGYCNVHTHENFGSGVTTTKSTQQIKLLSTQQQALNFIIKTQASDFYSVAPTTYLDTPSAGIEIVSSSIFEIPTGTTSFNYYTLAALTNTSHVIKNIITDNSDDKKYTKYRIGVTHADELGELLVGDGSTLIQLGIGPIIINSYSSHYADQQCFDFYGVTVEKSLTETNEIDSATVKSYFLFNSYAVNKATTPLSNLQAHMSINNYYSSGTMDGSTFPAVLRIFGYLTDAEKIVTKRIVVFFDNLQPFYSETENQGNGNVVGCGGSLSNLKCYGYNAYNPTSTKYNSVHLMKRIEIDVSTSIGQTSAGQPFQIIIPVKTLTSATQNLILGTLTQSPYVLSTKPYYQLNSIKAMTTNTATTQVSLALEGGYTSPNFVLTVNSQSLVGCKQSTSVSLNLQITGTINANSIPDYGAGFIWNAKWDFTNTDLSMTSSLVGTSTDQKCQSYWYCVDRSCTDKRYGIFCPLNSAPASGTLYTISLINMQFPTDNNLPGDMYSAISDKDGTYKAYQIDVGGSVLSPNFMTVTNFSSNLVKNQHSQNNSFQFTNTNDIPINGYIQVIAQYNLGFDCVDSDFCWIAQSSNIQESASLACSFQCIGFNGLRLTLKNKLVAGTWKAFFYGLSVGQPTYSTSTFTLSSYSSSGTIIDQTNSSSQGNITLEDQALTPSLDFGLYYFDFLYLDSYTTLQLDFKIYNKTYLQRNEYLQFILSPLFVSINQNKLICRVLQNGVQLDSFKNCIVDSNKLNIYPKNDIKITTNVEFSLFLENVLIFSSESPTTNITFSLNSVSYSLGEILKLTQSKEIHFESLSNLPEQVLAVDEWAFYKQPLNYISLPTDYTFTYLTNQTITTQTRIILKFPNYYLPRLSTSLILCKINDKYATHSFLSPRVLAIQFKTLNYEIEKNKTFNITIYKITQPSLESTDLSKIMLGISQDNNTFAETFWYTDTPLQQSLSKVASCSLHNVTYSTYYIRSYSTLTLTFKFSEISLNFQFNMTIFLNSMFETQLKYAIPQCHLVLTDDNYSSEVFCDNTYTTVNIYNISFPDEIKSEFFEIQLIGIPTPFYEINEKEYLIIFHYFSNTTSNTTIAYWTSTIKRNYELLSFTTDPSLLLLDLYKQDANDQKKFTKIDGEITPYIFELFPGYYSQKFQIRAGTILNGSNLEFFHDDQNRLVTNDETLLLKVGMNELNFTLGYSYAEAQGTVETQFFKTGLGVLDIFQELGRVKFTLLPPFQQVISMENYASNYIVPVGGFAKPIFLNLSSIVPVDPFSVVCEVTQGTNLGNYLEFFSSTTPNNKSIITMPFNKNQIFGIILVRSLSLSTFQTNTQIACHIEGNNTDIFALSQTSFSVSTLLAEQEDQKLKNSAPTLEITNIDNSFSTKIVFTMQVDQDSTFIWWHLSYNNSIPVYTREEIAQKLPSFHYSHKDPFQNQIGIIYSELAYNIKNLEINNLFANYTYKIVFLLENSYGQQNQSEYIFKTLDNEASSFRLTLSLSENITQKLMKQVCCFNQIYFQILLSDHYQAQFIGGPNAINCWSDLSNQEVMPVIDNLNATNDTNLTEASSSMTIDTTSYSNLQTKDSFYPIFYIEPNITYEIFAVDAYNYTYQDLYATFDSAAYFTKLYEYVPDLPSSIYSENIMAEFIQIPRQPLNILFHFSNSSWVENQWLTNFTIDPNTPYGYLYLVFTNYSTELGNQTQAIENQLIGEGCTANNLFNFAMIREKVTSNTHYDDYKNNNEFYFYSAHIFLNASLSNQVNFGFSHLTKNLTYSLYYYVTSEDPTIHSQTSDLFKLTLRIEEPKASFANIVLSTSFKTFILLIFLLLGFLV